MSKESLQRRIVQALQQADIPTGRTDKELIVVKDPDDNRIYVIGMAHLSPQHFNLRLVQFDTTQPTTNVTVEDSDDA